LIEEREEEASRIGRVLHDEIGQLLTAAGFQLEAVRRLAALEPQSAAAQLADVQEVFERVIAVVRELSHSLPPSLVERVGLPFALERLVAQYRDRSSQTIRLITDPRARVLNPAGQAIYRIADCALANAVDHAGSERIEVFLRSKGAGVLLEIRAFGRGFDRAVQPPGIGLLLMEQSAQRTGLELTLDSRPGIGTIISVFAPQRHLADSVEIGPKGN
jgi:signal transduction histidine kinase